MIGQGAAVVSIGRFHLRGFLGWLFWGAAHIFFPIGVRNRVAVALNWLWSYVTFNSGARLITGYDAAARPDKRNAARAAAAILKLSNFPKTGAFCGFPNGANNDLR